jgi:hypothetical protein
LDKTDRSLCVCSYEDRPEAMDSLILMGESLCRADAHVSLHLTVPDAPPAVRAWAERRPEVVLRTERPEGVSGWNIKPWLLLQELNAGSSQALWLDDDIIVTRPVSALLDEFPRESLIVAEEWTSSTSTVEVSHFWNLPSARPIPVFNNCFIRATQANRTMLERWHKMLHDPRYLDAQTLPFERRPIHLRHDGWPLIALLESAEFSQVPFNCIRRGRHIAQCAGSSGYRPHDRVLDLFRGLPPLIHGLGRKAWESQPNPSRLQHFLLDLATDVSPYILAGRKVARELGMNPQLVEARTLTGAVLRGMTNGHPGMAGLPLAILHAFHKKISQATNSG